MKSLSVFYIKFFLIFIFVCLVFLQIKSAYSASSESCNFTSSWNNFSSVTNNCTLVDGLSKVYRVSNIPSDYFISAEWWVSVGGGPWQGIKVENFNGNANPSLSYFINHSSVTIEVDLIGNNAQVLETHTWNLDGRRNLTVTKSGNGTGTITSNPNGINCGSQCSAGFPYNQAITLSANAANGSVFEGWSGGGCTGTSNTCTVTMDQTRNVSASFGSLGSLRVNIAPAEAVEAGARWRLNNGVWRQSGATVSNLQPGQYTVSFNTINGWNQPGSRTVTVQSGQLRTENTFYNQQTGSVQVNISPQSAVNAGARWRIVGSTAWLNSGQNSDELLTGSYQIEFKETEGFVKPPNQIITIEGNQTKLVLSNWSSSMLEYYIQASDDQIYLIPIGSYYEDEFGQMLLAEVPIDEFYIKNSIGNQVYPDAILASQLYAASRALSKLVSYPYLYVLDQISIASFDAANNVGYIARSEYYQAASSIFTSIAVSQASTWTVAGITCVITAAPTAGTGCVVATVGAVSSLVMTFGDTMFSTAEAYAETSENIAVADLNVIVGRQFMNKGHSLMLSAQRLVDKDNNLNNPLSYWDVLLSYRDLASSISLLDDAMDYFGRNDAYTTSYYERTGSAWIKGLVPTVSSQSYLFSLIDSGKSLAEATSEALSKLNQDYSVILSNDAFSSVNLNNYVNYFRSIWGGAISENDISINLSVEKRSSPGLVRVIVNHDESVRVGDLESYFYDFGDGSALYSEREIGGALPSTLIEHQYSENGQYEINVIFKSIDGRTSSASKSINIASISSNVLKVTPTANSNGSIYPSTIQYKNLGDIVEFEVIPNPGYTSTVGGTCGGDLYGQLYITNPLQENCTVVVHFDKLVSAPLEDRYELISNGSIIRDLYTGLEWQRCSVGQTWNGVTCIGEVLYLYANEIESYTANTDFSLPDVNQLRTIMFCSDTGQYDSNGDIGSCGLDATSPTINLNAFPNTPPAIYWTSTVEESSSIMGRWYGSFMFGASFWSSPDPSDNYPVRLVRVGIPHHLSAPSNVLVDEITAHDFKVKWHEVPGALGYRISVFQDSNLSIPLFEYMNHDVGNSTEYIIGNLNPNTQYFITVKSYNENSISEPSSLEVAYTASPDFYAVVLHFDDDGEFSENVFYYYHGESLTFDFTPMPGYSVREIYGCGGYLEGYVFTLEYVSSDCNIFIKYTKRRNRRSILPLIINVINHDSKQ